MPVRSVLAATLLLIALAAAAGCGGGSSPSASPQGEAAKSAQQVLADATKAAEGASSVHMSGQVTSDGKQLALDLTIAKGTGALGTMTFQGQPIDVVIVGGDAYMWAGSDFWSQYVPSATAQLVADKWLRYSTSNPEFAGMTKIADSKGMFDAMVTQHGTLTNKGATTYKGQSVVDIFDASPIDGGDLYIAATGPAYPVAVIAAAGRRDEGNLTFDSWNKKVTIVPPSGAIDLSQYTGG